MHVTLIAHICWGGGVRICISISHRCPYIHLHIDGEHLGGYDLSILDFIFLPCLIFSPFFFFLPFFFFFLIHNEVKHLKYFIFLVNSQFICLI